jgi:type IV secretory pathway component VirB8
MGEKDKLIQLSSMIESKAYYKKALDWYLEKYLRAFVNRSLWFSICASCVVILFVLYHQIQSWYPQIVTMPIVIGNDDVVKNKLIVTPLDPDKKYAISDLAILEYVLKYYVKLWEEYDQGDLNILRLDSRMKKINNLSSKEVLSDFQKNMYDPTAISPIIRLGSAGESNVKFSLFEFVRDRREFVDLLFSLNKKNFNMPRRAFVNFLKEEVDATGKKTSEKRQAIIDFEFSGVIYDTETEELTLEKFKVNEYSSEIFYEE